MKQIPELSQQYKSDVQTIHLLLAIDRYLIQVRKLRHAKEEKVKATYNAHRERTHRNETATTKGRGTRLETATTIATSCQVAHGIATVWLRFTPASLYLGSQKIKTTYQKNKR